ncbi:MAG TPA: adenylate/guanylate cyclase domain-containing protein, partial [Caulobacteraceae bacterium]|nr:adenylate/guanylate cyclase domain-containing protein [Caulobacteraceae bacterium]
MGVSDGMGRIHLGREPPIRLGALLIEPSLRRVVHDDGREEIVEPRVMQVLVALVRSGGAILTRDDLLAACWHGVVVGEDAITRVIGRLRRLTEGIGESQLKLETITKVGYRLVAASRPGEILPDPSPRALAGERRSIYAMFTDLAGFGRLTQALQPEAVADLLNAYLDRLNRVVLEHGGIVDKFIGDAMVAFWGAPIARPDDGECAVRAAIAIRRAEEEAFRATPIGDDPPLGPTRIGLHRGDAIVGAFGGEGRTAYTALGDVMNTASGLESANSALRTTVLISREALPPSTAGDFRAMGRIVLRGRSNPVEVFEAEFDFPRGARERLNAAYARFDAGDVAALGEFSALAAEFPRDAALRRLLDRLESVGPGGVFHLGASRTAAAKSEPLLAVLAFDDLSDGADMGWFSDGVSEEILQTVASGAALKVIGRGSSFQFRGAEKAASKVAAALKATHVLDGSVRRSGSTVRIAAHLIECASETTLWSDRFDRDLSDVFTLQDEIAAAVAAALKVALAPPAKAETIDPAAYDLFLRARQKASGFSDPAAVAAAIEMLEQATALAPRFARAWTLLAQALMGQFRFHGSEKPYATMRAKVVTAADTALGIDPGLGSAYVALSGLEPIGLYAKREALFSKALSVAPNDPEVISTIGWF